MPNAKPSTFGRAIQRFFLNNTRQYLRALRDLGNRQVLGIWLLGFAISLCIPLFAWVAFFYIFGNAGQWLLQPSSILDLSSQTLVFSWVGDALYRTVQSSWWILSSFWFSVIQLVVLGANASKILQLIAKRHYIQNTQDNACTHTNNKSTLFSYEYNNFFADSGIIDNSLGLIAVVIRYIVYLLPVAIISLLLFPLWSLLFGLWGWLCIRQLLRTSLHKQSNKHAQIQGLWFESLIVFILSTVPVVQLFAPVFGLVVSAHTLLARSHNRTWQYENILSLHVPNNQTAVRHLLHDEISGD